MYILCGSSFDRHYLQLAITKYGSADLVRDLNFLDTNIKCNSTTPPEMFNLSSWCMYRRCFRKTHNCWLDTWR